MKKILAVFAHPDDETFGPGGTLAKYASLGVDIHLLCATRGEAGEDRTDKDALKRKHGEVPPLGRIREDELRRAASIFGIQSVEFLDFIDGRLCNAIYHDLSKMIIEKIRSFKPDIIITLDRLGISGHIDHITVAMVTTYAHLHTKIAKKLYYQCLRQDLRDSKMDKYFIYFPLGYSKEQITTEIDYTDYWPLKKRAMMEHKSQAKDVENLLKRFERWPKIDFFIRAYPPIAGTTHETDLFSGL